MIIYEVDSGVTFFFYIMKPNSKLYELVMIFHEEFSPVFNVLGFHYACSLALSLFWDFSAHLFVLRMMILHLTAVVVGTNLWMGFSIAACYDRRLHCD